MANLNPQEIQGVEQGLWTKLVKLNNNPVVSFQQMYQN